MIVRYIWCCYLYLWLIVWLSIIPKRFSWISLLSLPVDLFLFYYFILCFLLFNHGYFLVWYYTLLILTQLLYGGLLLLIIVLLTLSHLFFSPFLFLFLFMLFLLFLYELFYSFGFIIPSFFFHYRLALGVPLLLWSTSFLIPIINCWIYFHSAFLILLKFIDKSLDELSLLNYKLTNLSRPFLYQELHCKRDT